MPIHACIDGQYRQDYPVRSSNPALLNNIAVTKEKLHYHRFCSTILEGLVEG